MFLNTTKNLFPGVLHCTRNFIQPTGFPRMGMTQVLSLCIHWFCSLKIAIRRPVFQKFSNPNIESIVNNLT